MPTVFVIEGVLCAFVLPPLTACKPRKPTCFMHRCGARRIHIQSSFYDMWHQVDDATRQASPIFFFRKPVQVVRLATAAVPELRCWYSRP